MAQNLTTIGFDADDTLWENEQFFRLTQERFAELLHPYVEGEDLYQKLLEAETRNLGHYGFGIKGFILSMIETAIDVSDERVPASVIAELIAAGQDMLRHPIELLPHAKDAVAEVSESHRVLMITKGDLLHQEQKLAQSGLGDLFDGVEIVSSKNTDVYREIFDRHGEGTERAMMVGNSMRSDVRPVIDAGGWGVFVPHNLTWEVEHAAPPDGHDKYHEISDLAALAKIVAEIG